MTIFGERAILLVHDPTKIRRGFDLDSERLKRRFLVYIRDDIDSMIPAR